MIVDLVDDSDDESFREEAKQQAANNLNAAAAAAAITSSTAITIDDESDILGINVTKSPAFTIPKTYHILKYSDLVFTPYGVGQVIIPHLIPEPSTSQGKKRKANADTTVKAIFSKIQYPFGVGYINIADIRLPMTVDLASIAGVTFTNTDLIRCQPKMMLNDTIINFAMKAIIDSFRAPITEQFEFLNSHAYSILVVETTTGRTALAYRQEKVRRIFKKFTCNGNLVIPVCFDIHWSFVIVCNIAEIVTQAKVVEELKRLVTSVTTADKKKNPAGSIEALYRKYQEEQLTDETPMPCILLFDSAGYHRAQTITKNVRRIFEIYLAAHLPTHTKIQCAKPAAAIPDQPESEPASELAYLLSQPEEESGAALNPWEALLLSESIVPKQEPEEMDSEANLSTQDGINVMEATLVTADCNVDCHPDPEGEVVKISEISETSETSEIFDNQASDQIEINQTSQMKPTVTDSEFDLYETLFGSDMGVPEVTTSTSIGTCASAGEIMSSTGSHQSCYVLGALVLPVISAEVEQQSNHCDCGVYLLQYLMRFLQNIPLVNRKFIATKGYKYFKQDCWKNIGSSIEPYRIWLLRYIQVIVSRKLVEANA